jgi:hypothetical protein
MKLKAPLGVGEPCVAGVAVPLRDGICEVEAGIGALLIECFGFVEIGAGETVKVPPAAAPAALRRPASAPLPRLTHPAWRNPPAAKKP